MAINTTNSPIPGPDGALIPAMGDITGQTARAIENTYAGVIIADTPLPDTSVVVSDGDSFDTVDGGTLAVTVADGVPTFTYTAGDA